MQMKTFHINYFPKTNCVCVVYNGMHISNLRAELHDKASAVEEAITDYGSEHSDLMETFAITTAKNMFPDCEVTYEEHKPFVQGV